MLLTLIQALAFTATLHEAPPSAQNHSFAGTSVQGRSSNTTTSLTFIPLPNGMLAGSINNLSMGGRPRSWHQAQSLTQGRFVPEHPVKLFRHQLPPAIV